MLQSSMGSPRVGHDLAIEQQQQQKWRINTDINKPSRPQDSNTLAADQSQNLSIYFLIPIPFPAMHVCYPVSLREAKVLVAQSCPTFCSPMDYSLPGSLSMEFPRQEFWSG